jgi:3-dehydroquinate dehydratase type I
LRLCIPITAKTTGEALRKMERRYSAPGFSRLLLELRVDGIRDLDLRRLLSKRRFRVIVTNRRKEEGGTFRGSEEERVKVLRQAVVEGADFVDIEAATPPALFSGVKEEIGARGRGTRLIVSSHDWTKTPSEQSLKERFAACTALGPHIVKIVTMAREPEDNLRVLGLIPHAGRQGVEVIAFCMGAEGRVSRMLSPLLGAYLSFASHNKKEASAPGQMTVREMVEMLQMIRGENNALSSAGPREAGERLIL